MANVVIIDVSGVGYLVHVTTRTAEKLGNVKDEVSIFTYLAVREHSLDLYGFLVKEEQHFFEMLIAVSGIGPKSALSILNIADVAALEAAVAAGDTSYLTKVSGVGKKSAERIIVELSDKLGVLSKEGDSAFLKEDTDVLEALKALGYGTREAREALRQLPKEIGTANSRLKETLKILGK